MALGGVLEDASLWEAYGKAVRWGGGHVGLVGTRGVGEDSLRWRWQVDTTAHLSELVEL